MRRLALAPVALCLLAASATAQPGLTNPQNADDEVPAHRSPPPPAPYGFEQPYAYAMPRPVLPEAKGEGTAIMLSLGATIAGYMMLGSAAERDGGSLAAAGLLTIVIGPSAGHIYAGETGHAVKMSLLRTAGLVTLMAGIIKSTGHVEGADCIDCSSHSSGSSSDNAGTLMLVGGITFVAATVYDVIDAAGAARRHNNRSLMVMPSYAKAPNGGMVPGVALGGRF